MRDRDTIDSELRRIALSRETIRARGGNPSLREVDELLDERLGHRVRAPAPAAVETRPAVARVITPTRRRHRRIARTVALPLSLVAAAAVLVVLIAHRSPHSAAPPAEGAPPTAETASGPAAQTPVHAGTQTPPVNVVDTAFVEALKRNNVPVPSREYAVNQAHAVCDFLSRQPAGAPTFTNAARFVQASSIWDATQSADVTAGAVNSYCPRYQLTGPPVQQPDMQKTLNDMQKIQGDLQGIQGGLQGIEGDLKGIQGVLPDVPGPH